MTDPDLLIDDADAALARFLSVTRTLQLHHRRARTVMRGWEPSQGPGNLDTARFHLNQEAVDLLMAAGSYFTVITEALEATQACGEIEGETIEVEPFDDGWAMAPSPHSGGRVTGP